ncbi:rhomboid family intramembrane serine protease [Trueperella pyogenes]|uniref:rhomboid family intramembrane serine protease n=1 Tax=Trueperella pyogenes TaxID=1661 RepID=UPI0024C04595|nr:rhomboid family intramembrane serine protease [Trueperella pyogenes]WHU60495.1 rhomboid family intramembrane serine protease [Trueperella pyogenes]
MMSDAERNFQQPDGEPTPVELQASSVRRRTTRNPVTIGLIVICGLAAIVGRVQPQVAAELSFYPPLASAQPYRFITSAFLHGGFWHLVLNMYALWLLGRSLEPVLGRWRFLVLYVVSAVAGNTAVFFLAALTGGWNIGAVGASGAIFGLFGALIVLSRRVRANMTGILVLLGLNLIFGFVMPGISWESHVGGLLAGAVLTWAWVAILDKFQNRRWRIILDAAAAIGVLSALLLLII